ncbi:hypothetical protein KAT63_03950 [Candidatus Parcubacteria bacterium]|nr:hypothetical protein [Candidatus Parcubacteria bacterium]
MKKGGFVFIFLILFFLTTPIAKASGASLYLSPNSGTFYAGSTFDVSIILNTGGNNVNAISADLKFDPKKIQVVSPVTGKSFISIWVTSPSYSNLEGKISFRGGIPSPGVNTSSGSALTITFRAIEPGETTLYFLDTSKVLLDDGKATEILNFTGSGKYIISLPLPEGPIVSSSTHPDQNKWYKNNNVAFSWNKEDTVSDFSYVLDTNPQGIPDNESKGNKSSVSFSNLKDGIWYFHIKAKKENNWGGISHYLARIDNDSPASFKIEVSPSTKTSFSQPIVSFITTDAFSKIDHYEVKTVDITAEHKNKREAFFIETASPYQLPILGIGKYLVIVRAYDNAGNWQKESIEIEIAPEKILITERGVWLEGVFLSWWPILLAFLILIISVLSILIILWQRERECKIQFASKLREREQIIRRNLEKSRRQ